MNLSDYQTVELSELWVANSTAGRTFKTFVERGKESLDRFWNVLNLDEPGADSVIYSVIDRPEIPGVDSVSIGNFAFKVGDKLFPLHIDSLNLYINAIKCLSIGENGVLSPTTEKEGVWYEFGVRDEKVPDSRKVPNSVLLGVPSHYFRLREKTMTLKEIQDCVDLFYRFFVTDIEEDISQNLDALKNACDTLFISLAEPIRFPEIKTLVFDCLTVPGSSYNLEELGFVKLIWSWKAISAAIVERHLGVPMSRKIANKFLTELGRPISVVKVFNSANKANWVLLRTRLEEYYVHGGHLGGQGGHLGGH